MVIVMMMTMMMMTYDEGGDEGDMGDRDRSLLL